MVVPASLNPLDVLDELLSEVVQVKNYLGGLAHKMADGDLRYAGRSGEQLRAEWQLYSAMLRDCQRFAESMIKLDLDARRVRLREAEATMLLGVITAVFADVGLSMEQKRLAAVSVPARLREASGGEPAGQQEKPAYTGPRKSPTRR